MQEYEAQVIWCMTAKNSLKRPYPSSSLSSDKKIEKIFSCGKVACQSARSSGLTACSW